MSLTIAKLHHNSDKLCSWVRLLSSLSIMKSSGVHNVWTAWNSSGLTLTVLVMTIDAQWEGMGDVGSARYEPAQLPHARP